MRAMVGVIAPGEFHFNTAAAGAHDGDDGIAAREASERDWQSFPAGTYFEVPANSGFDVCGRWTGRISLRVPGVVTRFRRSSRSMLETASTERIALLHRARVQAALEPTHALLDVPCVKASGGARPCVRRSSPIALAALRPSSISPASKNGRERSALCAHSPAKQSACNSCRRKVVCLGLA